MTTTPTPDTQQKPHPEHPHPAPGTRARLMRPDATSPRDRAGARLWSAAGLVVLARILTLKKQRRILRLKNPRTFSDYVQRRKFLDRSPALAWTCDKLAMKETVSALDVSAAVPRTLWFGNDLEDLIEAGLSGRWVLKPNDSSGVVHFGSGPVGTDDLRIIDEELGNYNNPWDSNGEWAYSQARSAYLVEQLLDEPPLPDYKVFVFWGRAVCVDVHVGRFGHRVRQTFTRDWTPMAPVYADGEPGTIGKPIAWDMIVRDAERIAQGFEFMRVDFYVVGDTVYFGETTPYPGSGLSGIDGAFDRWMGKLWRSGSAAAVDELMPTINQFVP